MTTTLRAVDDLNSPSLLEQAERNVVDFLRWALVGAGGFGTVAVPTPGTRSAYGDETLFPVHDDGVADGVIWQSRHPDWCFEAGTDRTVAAGVYVNGTFSTAGGTYAHRLDFPGGRVRFNAAIPTTSVVQAAYSYHTVAVVDQSVPWFRPVVLDGYLTEQSAPGAVLALLDRYRVQTPLIVVEASLGRRSYGKELGSRVNWQEIAVLCHVLASRKSDRDRLADALLLQKDTPLDLYDAGAAAAAGHLPLDWYGSPNANGKSYPQLLAAHPWRSGWISQTSGSDVDPRLPLYRGVVRLTLTVDR